MRARGFTLVELMVVVAIAGIMTSLAVTGLQQTIAATIESRTARSAAQLVRRARASAVARHQRVGLRVDPVSHAIEVTTCQQRFGAPECVTGAGFVADPGNRMLFTTEFRGVRVDAPPPDAAQGNNAIIFNADGFPAGGTTSVWRFDQPATAGSTELIITVGGDVRTQSSTTSVTTDEI